MFVLVAGGELAGVLGVLFAIPVAGACKVILPDLLSRYCQSRFFRGGQRKEVIHTFHVEEEE